MKTKKKKLIVHFSLLILSSFVLYSCYPDYGLTTSDYDTVITMYDNSADFNKPTYAMPDTVVHFVEAGEEDNVDRSKDALILSTIANNMTRLGYERVPVDTSADAPDFVILVGVTVTDNYGTAYYPGYGYWGGWGWWGGYPGWGYPGGSVTYSSSLNTSTRITQRINDAFNQSPYLGAN